MRRRYVAIFLSGVILLISSCSPVSMVKPLQKNQWAATGTLGGPLIGFGNSTIPVPFTTLGAAYGITDKSTGILRLHTTSALFGVAHLDAGWLHQWCEAVRWKPGLSTVAQGALMVDTWKGNARFYPSLDVNAWWNTNLRGDFIYTGMTTWFELQSTGALGREQKQHVLPAWNLGYTLQRVKWNVGFEVKYLAPGNSHQNLTVDYKSPGTKGAIGTYLSFTRKF